MKHYTDSGKLDSRWVTTDCKGDWKKCVRDALEERGEPPPHPPDWMLSDGTLDDTDERRDAGAGTAAPAGSRKGRERRKGKRERTGMIPSAVKRTAD